MCELKTTYAGLAQVRRVVSGGAVRRAGWAFGLAGMLFGAPAYAIDAIDDTSYTTNEDVALSEPAPGVLGNDHPQSADPITVVSNTQPAHGSVTVNADGSFMYTPADDYFGPDSFEYTAENDTGSDTARVQISVDPVNDAPMFTDGGNVTANEDAGSVVESAWATGVSPGPNEAGQTLTFNVTVDSGGALFATPPAVDAGTGDLTFILADDANGSANITLTLSDDGGTANGGQDTSTAHGFTITVDAVNDAPAFTGGGNVTVSEDDGSVVESSWASGMSPGPADEDGQTLTFNVTVDSGATLFDIPPAVDPSTGDLTFTLAAEANGSADVSVTLSDDGGTANGGEDTSAAHDFTITVNPVNDAPTFTGGGNVTVSEDDGSVVEVGWASGMSPGPANEDGQTLTFNVTVDSGGALFATPPAVDAGTGNLTFTLAGDANGSANVSVTLSDDGGTANGGQDTSTAHDFTITVDAVNDAPTFSGGGNVTVNEDDGSVVESGWATGMSPGPADEGGQALTFSAIVNSGGAIFATPPSVDPSTGELSFTPAPDANGSADVTVTLSDDGGTANGGQDTSLAHDFTITVQPVNDPPTFSPGGDQSTLEDSGPQSVPGWIVGFSVGPQDEEDAGQIISYAVTEVSDPSLFASGPAVSSDGTLSYTPADDAVGTAAVTLVAQDSGGGDDTSDPATFNITIDPVNDAPTFTGGGNVTVNEDAGSVLESGWATGMSPGPADEAGQVLTFSAIVNSGGAIFATPPSVDLTTGDLTFTLAADANGSADVTVTLSDDGGIANGGQDTSLAQDFTITVQPVNDPPTFTPGDDQSTLEDSGPQSVPGWIVGFSVGPQDEVDAGQTISYPVTDVSDPALFAAGPEVSADGTLSYTPADDAFGTAAVTLVAQDSGGGDDTSEPATFNITIDPINDAPTFTGGGNVIVDEDAGPRSLTGWASNISPGATNETGQNLTFEVVLNDNEALFATLPAIDPATGTLTFETTFDANGSANITIELVDDGGTDDGGVNRSDPYTFGITVDPVNDIPDAADDAVAMSEDSGPITIAVMCNDYLAEQPTGITVAGVDGFSESEPTTVLDANGDPVTAPNGQVQVVEDGAVCDVDGDGEPETVDVVQYLPKEDFYGEDFFTYTIADVHGDQSTATVTVTVSPVNDAPVGIQQKDYFMQENSSLVVSAESGLLAGAYDVDGALVDEDGQPIGSVITATITRFPTVGSLSFDAATGSFEYQPPVDFIGAVEFEYRLSDGELESEGAAYRVAITVLEAPPAPEPPPPGEVATIFNLANAPLEQSTSVPPNVLVVMDDSGSMDWNVVIPGPGHDGTFVLDNSDVARWNGRMSVNYTYLWDLRNNAYPPTSGNGRILPTEEALNADSDMVGNHYGVWRARTHLYNPLYYNPEILYTPWTGQDAANQEFEDADPASVRLDPRNPSTNARDRINLLDNHTYRSSSVPRWTNSGGSENIDVEVYIPHYYATPEEPPLAWNDDHEKIEIKDGAGPLDGGMFPGGPDREDCALDDGDPTDCTYEQELQNFANFFQYYRSREYVTKNGIGKVISQLQDIRIGYMTISATTTIDIREMNALHTEGNKKDLLDNAYRVDSFGGTPLRQALGRAGDTFACDFGRMDCPILPEPEGFCQQNFALLFSDGYWNGGTGTTGNPDGDDDTPFDGGRYADSVDATLADVAMYYYENDLHSDLADEVPVMRRDIDGVPDGVFSGADPKMHQHMKTYTIAFGVTGTIDPADIPTNPAEPFSWPNPFSGNEQKIDDMLHTAVNGRGRFLNAGTPTELQAAFESAFLEFTQAASSTSAAAFNSTSLQEGTLLFRGFYDLRDNTGELTATLVDEDGNLAETPAWRASERLNPANKLPDNRVIITFDPGSGGIAFRHGDLVPEQQITLNLDQVDYLRGVRTAEVPDGSLRERPASNGLLGDIVNSSPVFVGSPRAINRDQRPFPTDDLYSEFAEAKKDRTPVVYVGANDGMLHGFNGLIDGGEELFAYVPNKIIDSSQGHKNPLDLFTNQFYQHRYYVDLSPRLNDVYMRASRTAIGKSWNTVLVGGLGVGGKGFFALNVTNPDTTFSNEINARQAALWEFTDEDDTYPDDVNGNPLGGSVGAVTDPLGKPVKDLGYAVTPPIVAMSNIDDGGSPARKEWVAIFGNGPNSTAGIAKLFVLFMDRGLNGWEEGDFVKLHTGFGVQPPPHPLAGYPNALGTPAAVDTDLNGTVDRVYAGDRLGNLFRFDLCARVDGECSNDPDDWTVTRIFTASYDTGTIQPILTEPLVIKHPTERGFLVVFGTGSYLTRDDADSEDIQSIYAIWDEGSSNPVTAQSNTREDRLVEQTITNVMDNSFNPPLVRRIVSKNPVEYRQDDADGFGTYGWYVDLDMERADGDSTGRAPPEPQFPGEKAIRRLLFRDGTIITTTVLPSLDEFSCFGTRPGSILLFDAVTGGDAGRPVVDFNTDGRIDAGDLVSHGDEEFAGGVLFNQQDLEGQLVDLSTLGGEGDTDFLFVSGGDDTRSYRIEDVNDSRTGRLSWRELD